MALIRHADDPARTRDALVLDLGDLRASARRVLEAAAEEARGVITRATDERARLLATATAEGRKAGFEQGLAEGRAKGHAEGLAKATDARSKELAAVEAGWTKALGEFESQRRAMLSEAGRGVVDLALMIARDVTRRTIEADPGVAVALVEEAVGLMMAPTRLTVRVNPEDAALVRESLPGLGARFATIEHAEVIEDASLDRGSCVARSASGEVDSSIATRVARIAEAIAPGRPAGVNAGDTAGGES